MSNCKMCSCYISPLMGKCFCVLCFAIYFGICSSCNERFESSRLIRICYSQIHNRELLDFCYSNLEECNLNCNNRINNYYTILCEDCIPKFK